MDFDPYRYDFEKYFEKLIKRKKALNRKQTNKQKDKKDILLLDFVMENLQDIKSTKLLFLYKSILSLFMTLTLFLSLFLKKSFVRKIENGKR